MPVKTVIQLRRDTAANWASTNPVLASGEAGLETDTNKTKYGNGTSAWNSLAYSASGLKVSDTAPTGATAGDMWLDSTSGKTFVYYDSYWVETSSNNKGADGRYTVADSAPLTPTTGDTWFNSTNGKQYVYMDSYWVEPNSNLAGVQGNAGPQANVNAIINGAFDIWQRGLSIPIAASTALVYTTDRWVTTTGANQAITVSRQPTGDTTNLPNIQYCARYQRNSGQTGTGGTFFTQPVETKDAITLAGKPFTFSFYARKGANYSPTANALTVLVYSGTGTDQNVLSGYTGSVTAASSTVTLTSTWQRFTISGTFATNATEFAPIFYYNPTGTAGADDWYEITGVQLEAGSVATPFKRNAPSLQAELAACQRYYWRSTPGKAYGSYGTGSGYSATNVGIMVNIPNTMRTVPSSVEYGNLVVDDNVNTLTISNLVLDTDYSSFNYATLYLTVASGGAQFRPYRLKNNNNNAGYLGFNAEL